MNAFVVSGLVKRRGSANGPLLGFPDLSLNVLARRTFERQQLITGTLRLYAEQPHPCSAFEALPPFNRIGVRCRWLVSGHTTTLRLFPVVFQVRSRPGMGQTDPLPPGIQYLW